MRETTSAVWQKKFFTTDTKMDLPYSKDNYFFAVQSVSEDGNEGLPVIPYPWTLIKKKYDTLDNKKI